jgi:hypothetical protein
MIFFFFKKNNHFSLQLTLFLRLSSNVQTSLLTTDTALIFKISLVGSPVDVKAVISLPILVSSGDRSSSSTSSSTTALMAVGAALQPSCLRQAQVLDTTFHVLECPGSLGIGGKVWDSTFVLLAYLSQFREALVRGKEVLELGSGTGLAGARHPHLLLDP